MLLEEILNNDDDLILSDFEKLIEEHQLDESVRQRLREIYDKLVALRTKHLENLFNILRHIIARNTVVTPTANDKKLLVSPPTATEIQRFEQAPKEVQKAISVVSGAPSQSEGDMAKKVKAMKYYEQFKDNEEFQRRIEQAVIAETLAFEQERRKLKEEARKDMEQFHTPRDFATVNGEYSVDSKDSDPDKIDGLNIFDNFVLGGQMGFYKAFRDTVQFALTVPQRVSNQKEIVQRTSEEHPQHIIDFTEPIRLFLATVASRKVTEIIKDSSKRIRALEPQSKIIIDYMTRELKIVIPNPEYNERILKTNIISRVNQKEVTISDVISKLGKHVKALGNGEYDVSREFKKIYAEAQKHDPILPNLTDNVKRDLIISLDRFRKELESTKLRNAAPNNKSRRRRETQHTKKIALGDIRQMLLQLNFPDMLVDVMVSYMLGAKAKQKLLNASKRSLLRSAIGGRDRRTGKQSRKNQRRRWTDKQ